MERRTSEATVVEDKATFAGSKPEQRPALLRPGLKNKWTFWKGLQGRKEEEEG